MILHKIVNSNTNTIKIVFKFDVSKNKLTKPEILRKKKQTQIKQKSCPNL